MSTEFKKDDFFKIDPEPHLIGDIEAVSYFPGVQMWWRAIENIKRPLISGAPPEAFEGMEEWEMVKTADPDSLLRAMDKYGVDIACLLPESMMDATGFASRWCTNGEMAKVVESNPDRFMYQPNVSPIKYKGVKNTIWELEYWVKEKGAKIFKFYPPDDQNQDEQIGFITTYLDINPSDIILHEYLSRIYMDRKDYQKAKLEIKTMLKYYSSSGSEYFRLAVCEFYLENYDESMSYLIKAQELGESVPEEYIEIVKEKLARKNK